MELGTYGKDGMAEVKKGDLVRTYSPDRSACYWLVGTVTRIYTNSLKIEVAGQGAVTFEADQTTRITTPDLEELRSDATTFRRKEITIPEIEAKWFPRVGGYDAAPDFWRAWFFMNA